MSLGEVAQTRDQRQVDFSGFTDHSAHIISDFQVNESPVSENVVDSDLQLTSAFHTYTNTHRCAPAPTHPHIHTHTYPHTHTPLRNVRCVVLNSDGRQSYSHWMLPGTDFQQTSVHPGPQAAPGWVKEHWGQLAMCLTPQTTPRAQFTYL